MSECFGNHLQLSYDNSVCVCDCTPLYVCVYVGVCGSACACLCACLCVFADCFLIIEALRAEKAHASFFICWSCYHLFCLREKSLRTPIALFELLSSSGRLAKCFKLFVWLA
jgi:hypothetical protein